MRKITISYGLLLGFCLSLAVPLCAGKTENKSNRRLLAKHPLIAMSLAGCTPLTLYFSCYGIMWLKNRNSSPNITLEEIQGSSEDNQEITLFAPGIAETHKQAQWYTKEQNPPTAYFIDSALYSYDYPDATKRFWRVNFPYTALGQEYEVKGFESAYEQLMKKYPERNIILMGLSRGAATVLNFVGSKQPKNIKALILESPFDSTATVAHNMLQKCKLDHIPGLKTAAHHLMSAIFWQHSTHGMQPIDTIKNIDKELPILFICSKKDTLVPSQSTINLYRTLKEEGHKHVHIFIAQEGMHGRILHDIDGANYVKAVHAFYKKCGLTCNEILATEGEKLLDT